MLAMFNRAQAVERMNPTQERSLRPAIVFRHPRDVLDNPILEIAEKRAILASWASDASAVEDRPDLRWLPGTEAPVHIDDVLGSLAKLDMPQNR